MSTKYTITDHPAIVTVRSALDGISKILNEKKPLGMALDVYISAQMTKISLIVEEVKTRLEDNNGGNEFLWVNGLEVRPEPHIEPPSGSHWVLRQRINQLEAEIQALNTTGCETGVAVDKMISDQKTKEADHDAGRGNNP